VIAVCYISETYLFTVASNVGFLKRFGGLWFIQNRYDVFF